MKILHLPKGRVLCKLHQSWTWLGRNKLRFTSKKRSLTLRAGELVSLLHCPQAHRSKNEASYLLLFLAKAEPRRPLLQHQAGDALGAWASCATHDHVHISVTSSTDEGLQKGTRRKGWLPYTNPEPSAAAGVQWGKDPTVRRCLGTQRY